jgi:hypothetical protein
MPNLAWPQLLSDRWQEQHRAVVHSLGSTMPLGRVQAIGATAEAFLTPIIHGSSRCLSPTVLRDRSARAERVCDVFGNFRYGDRMWLNIALE